VVVPYGCAGRARRCGRDGGGRGAFRLWGWLVRLAGALKSIRLGSSGSVRVGQPVVALGASLWLTGSVKAGIVSALDRTVEAPGGGRPLRAARVGRTDGRGDQPG
jgi:hypothetical protein